MGYFKIKIKMLQKKMFGITNKDSVMKSVFTNDWQHSVLFNKGA